MNNYNYDDLVLPDILTIYKMVFKGILEKFPEYFFKNEDSIENSNKYIRFLTEEWLKLSDEDLSVAL
ncbi:hypothetical protein FDB37_15780 [Clostridium botulinum]|nr:hypothetical protein [Clostridium botulinum]